jgi:uncharacterized protein
VSLLSETIQQKQTIKTSNYPNYLVSTIHITNTLVLRIHGETDMEYIETGFEIKELANSTDENIVTFRGYAGVFGNIDSHRDILQQGCSTKSLSESKGIIPILDSHQSYSQIGWNKQATEDTIGIDVLGELNLTVQKAKEVYALALQAKKLGAPMGLSIGYITKKYILEEETDIRTLTEIDLKEYSFVAFPSNKRASVLSIKSIASELAGFGITEDPKALEGLLREVGFSASVSKKTATTAMQLSKKTQLDTESLREVDESEVKDVLEAMRIMNATTELQLLRA